MIDSDNKRYLSVLYCQRESGDAYVCFCIDLLEITAKYREIIKPMQVDFPAKKMFPDITAGEKGYRIQPPIKLP